MQNYVEKGNTGWNELKELGLDSKFQAQLDYSEWTRMQPKSLIYLVDETGVEPATSSLRTM
jgi:hypothetical protein